MDITLKEFTLNRTKDGSKYYFHLHNTISTSYAGDIRTVILCNVSKEVREQLKEQPDKMFVEQASGFMSVTLQNAKPVPIIVINKIKIGEWDESRIR